MAPELLMHGRCSRASDVYSYGILLWELATGSKAFAGGHVFERFWGFEDVPALCR
jgi:serine/threonine protein kinase